ncbi:MAG: phosphatidylethanolamine-binding protein [Candidatus Levybacteria bacterium RIFCSPLOWO2_01_FULL_38_21]|nr:MAG: phosphatidylethanolamine-binding protein [Candidatus Levybacteria bacterium RIFCSPLOWO2_01_FULL_38_21]
MKITSSAFKYNSKIPSKYTCDDKNINPPLEFSDIPRETKSLVLIIDDPDAPSKTWVHWVIYNIDPSVTKIEENSVPKGLLGRTDFGKEGYGGPCPPSGTHRYFFKLYALDTILDAPNGLTKQQVLEKTRDRVIEEAELIGLYKRP